MAASVATTAFVVDSKISPNSNLLLEQNQSHYREVPWWEMFMEQELRFGPVGITE